MGDFIQILIFVSGIPDCFIPEYVLMWHPVSKVLFYEWVNKMGYYSTENEIMPFATMWMNLEIIILTEVSQTKTNTVWYHLYEESKIGHK